MSNAGNEDVGKITWRDLTIENAEPVRDFYEKVVGWKSTPEDMGGYCDFSMFTPGDECVAGICHARGTNAGMPPQWLMYVTVEDVDKSAAACTEMGGEVVVAPRKMGSGRVCVIKDPAGAVCALYRP